MGFFFFSENKTRDPTYIISMYQTQNKVINIRYQKKEDLW